MNHSHRKDDAKMKFCLVTVGEIDKKPYAHKFIHMESLLSAHTAGNRCMVY